MANIIEKNGLNKPILAHNSSYRKSKSHGHVNSSKGLSNTTHLTARLVLRKSQNLEGQAFIIEKFGSKNGKAPNPKGRKKGQIIQHGLTSRGRKVIRVVSDCYQSLVLNKFGFRDEREFDENRYNKFCRFITLTFRNIIPDDKTAKKLLHNFFKRLQRKTGHLNHYLWVAERQKRGAIHFHILTPEKIIDDTNLTKVEMRTKENVWINRAWNEVVCNWAYRAKKISIEQKREWLNEYSKSESYYKSLAKYRGGEIKKKPSKPSKSKFMLLPNCVHVLSAGRYMVKYMSKEGQNIIGGMYDASKTSRNFMKTTDVVDKDFGVVMLGNEVIKFMYHRAKKEGVFVQFRKLDYNGSMGIWCNNIYKLLEWYYQYDEIQKNKEVNNFNNRSSTPSTKTLCYSKNN